MLCQGWEYHPNPNPNKVISGSEDKIVIQDIFKPNDTKQAYVDSALCLSIRPVLNEIYRGIQGDLLSLRSRIDDCFIISMATCPTQTPECHDTSSGSARAPCVCVQQWMSSSRLRCCSAPMTGAQVEKRSDYWRKNRGSGYDTNSICATLYAACKKQTGLYTCQTHQDETRNRNANVRYAAPAEIKSIMQL